MSDREMSDREMSDQDINELLDQMTLTEMVSLLAGTDYWHTAAIQRLGIPPMRVSDGPAGARGTSFRGPASLNVPCGTALAATWDPRAVQEIGKLLGREARAKGARVLLARSDNLHRTPIGDRNFECMERRPVPHRQNRCRLRQRGSTSWRCVVHQTLHRQRHGVRTQHDRFANR